MRWPTSTQGSQRATTLPAGKQPTMYRLTAKTCLTPVAVAAAEAAAEAAEEEEAAAAAAVAALTAAALTAVVRSAMLRVRVTRWTSSATRSSRSR